VPLRVIEGGGIPEPDWAIFFQDELDVRRARDVWAIAVRELKDADKLSPANAFQLERYAYNSVMYDVAARHVAEEGAVFPRKGKKQPAYNNWFSVLKDAHAMLSAAEAELTITPRRRNNGGKVSKKPKRTAASDEFLAAVPGRPGNALGAASR
jgi:phage terminase small subunit